jgi:hypothetical protein
LSIGDEEQKSGIRKSELQDFLKELNQFQNIKLQGLMCVPPIDNPEYYFQKMNSLFNKYKEKYDLNVLSMGMSSDYKQAIKHGSNMVRIGTSIFGSRI